MWIAGVIGMRMDGIIAVSWIGIMELTIKGFCLFLRAFRVPSRVTIATRIDD